MKRKHKFLIGSILLTLFFLVAFVLEERVRGQWAVNRIVREMTESGAELDATKLAPGKPRDEENIAPELMAAASGLPRMRETPPLMLMTTPGDVVGVFHLRSWTNAHPFGENLGETTSWESLSNRIAAMNDRLDKIQNALKKEFYWSGFKYDQGFHEFTSGLSEILNTCHCLAAKSLVLAKAGQKEESFAALAALMRMTQVLKDEPLIITQLVRQAAASIAFGVLRQTLELRMWDDAHLKTLQELWEPNDFRADMLRAMNMERAMTRDHWRVQRQSRDALRKAVELDAPMEEFMDEDGRIPLNSWQVRFLGLPMWRLAWSYHDEFNSMRLWRSRVRDAELAMNVPWSELKDSTGDLETMNWQLGNEMNSYNQLRFLFSARSIFSSTLTLRKGYEAEVVKALATTALGIERFRLQNGRVPLSLGELKDFGIGTSTDLMDGKPLRYRMNDTESFSLYSVGRNSVDDGGDASIEGEGEITTGIWDRKDMVWPKLSKGLAE